MNLRIAMVCSLLLTAAHAEVKEVDSDCIPITIENNDGTIEK
ncbi:hypothetical protein [Photobacterium sp. OFAV2-7]|nr:hypothetical protein [Photobacterium sp. OFAV2-7]